MEQKLNEFKSRRRKENLLSMPKKFFTKLINRILPKKENSNEEVSETLAQQNFNLSECRPNKEDETSMSQSSGSVSDISMSSPTPSWLTTSLYILHFLLWLVVYLIAVQLEFGYVYLVISGLALIYFNTRTGPKKEGEISAYSVFNPGCESIQGTLKAEHLEREFNLILHDKPESHSKGK